MKTQWTKQSIIDVIAKDCNTVIDFNTKHRSAYRAAKILGVFEEVTQHLSKRFLWTKELIQQEALKYTTRSEFSIKNPSAYFTAVKYHWLDEVCEFMGPNVSILKWTPELIAQEAKKFTNRTEFWNTSPGAYSASLKSGNHEIYCAHMPSQQFVKTSKWTAEVIREEAKKYKTRGEFSKNSRSAYINARKLNLMDELFPLK